MLNLFSADKVCPLGRDNPLQYSRFGIATKKNDYRYLYACMGGCRYYKSFGLKLPDRIYCYGCEHPSAFVSKERTLFLTIKTKGVV